MMWVQNIGIVVWHAAPTASIVDRLWEEAAEVRAKYPGGMSFVHVGSTEAVRMDSAARESFLRILKEFRSSMAATAIVARAEGFLASTVRSVVTGILVLSRVSHEIRFHENALEVLEWLPEKHSSATGVTVDLDRLRSALLQAEQLY